MDRIFVLGYPHPVGGAGGELLHALSVWRRHGVMPTLIPTWYCDDPSVRERMTALGYKTLVVPTDVPGGFMNIPGIRGSTIISFCNAHAVVKDTYRLIREMGCRFIWSPTMCYTYPHEIETFEAHGLPDRIVYQSEYQRSQYEGELIENGFTDAPAYSSVVRGAFDVESWPFSPRPHKSGEPFVIGKLGRADPNKWARRLWGIYGQVRYEHRRAVVMGMSQAIADRLGPTPSWAEWHKPNSFPARDYFGMIDVLAPCTEKPENFPRVTLEAYASGVPVVAPRDSGWMEQIIHGETGFLAGSEEETVHYIEELIRRPELRAGVVQSAREYLVDELCREDRIWEGWEDVFEFSVAGSSASS